MSFTVSGLASFSGQADLALPDLRSVVAAHAVPVEDGLDFLDVAETVDRRVGVERARSVHPEVVLDTVEPRLRREPPDQRMLLARKGLELLRRLGEGQRRVPVECATSILCSWQPMQERRSPF